MVADSSSNRTDRPLGVLRHGHPASIPSLKAVSEGSVSYNSIRPSRRIRVTREPKNVLVVIFQGLGDLVLAVPAFRRIRERFPKSRLTLATKRNQIELIQRESFFDTFVPIDLPAGPTAIGEFATFIRQLSTLRRLGFDLLINLTTPLSVSTYFKCLFFNWSFAPTAIVSGTLADILCFRANGESIRYRYLLHETALKFRILGDLVAPPGDLVPRLSCSSSESPVSAAIPNINSTTIVGVCAEGSRQTQRWPAEKFLKCLKALQAISGVRILLLGNAPRLEETSVLRNNLRSDDLDLVAKVSTGELPDVINHLDVLITNDTGPMHIAAAVEIPIVAIFASGSPSRYAPLLPPERCAIFYRQAPCGPCIQRHCSHRWCTEWIEPAHVAAAAIDLANRNHSRTAHVAQSTSIG